MIIFYNKMNDAFFQISCPENTYLTYHLHTFTFSIWNDPQI